MAVSPDKHAKRWIRPLPKQVINKIAAGEVVERPASVVKELVENSIDAGSDRIDIIIEKSGTKLIKIVDNGAGIEKDQMEIAFARHATSKISSFQDLDNLHSYGFRGEALPSIASVSRLRMVSRVADADSGYEIIFEGGVLKSLKPIAAAPGTVIEVENLFFNTPARRKFLKSESTESRHISRIATAMAIGRFDLAFSLNLNSRSIFSLPTGSSLRERVSGILAPNKKFVSVSFQSDKTTLEGFIGVPELAQNNRYGLYLFINNRFIYSATFSHALKAGYEELLPGGKFPIGTLLLTVDPAEIDVNVHPTKTEVRLSNEREIHDIIFRAVRDALRQDGIIPSFRAGHGFAGLRSSGDASRPRPGASSVIPGIGVNHPANTEFLSQLYRHPDNIEIGQPIAEPSGEHGTVRVDTHTGEIIEGPTTEPADHTGPSGGFRLVGRFADLYLLLQSGEDLYIVDQHTAHERVLYEQTLERVDRQSADSQQLLFPVQIELSPVQFAVFEDSTELLTTCGFSAAAFGGRTVNINAVPALLSKKSPERLFGKIIDDIASLRKAGLDLKKAVAQSIACRAAVMSGDRLTDREATHLLDRLLQCDNKYSCPHGRPTFIKITRQDLDRQFGRE